ncbi:hypothetical protein BDN70DRAFT_115891 [Pholiota conissans]|uniref:Uncharacterized protein n=1 Tax=Pholiota conissans TaxID=109636 RepID=A0A9P6CSF9_9AGAR|nr:hypothetical protein BDN70DRAFT_115891 [Pholiota conissans]
MAEYDDYQNQGTYARYSQHSVTPSAQSWTQPAQRQPSAPPPQPVNLPTPVQAVRPLPVPGNAGNRASIQSTAPLRVVNKTPPTAQLDHILQRNVTESEYETATTGTPKPRRMWSLSSSSGRARPQRKKSFVGGFFNGVKKLPKTVFGYGAGMGPSEKNKLRPGDAYLTEGTSTSELTSSTLPAYSSNPSSPIVRVPGPGRTRMNLQRRGDGIAKEPTIPESSPLPEVVRLEDQRHSNIPSVRVTPPSGSYGEDANIYGEEYPDYPENPSIDPFTNNPGERTTYMVYNDRNSYYYDRNQPAPASMQRQATTSPGLSYVDSQPPASQHSSAAASTVRDIRPANDIVQSTAPESGARLSYAAPTPQHATSYSMPVGALQLSSVPTAHSLPQSQIEPQNPVVHNSNADVAPANLIGSPQSVHPEPTIDYRKMSLSSSPTSHDTYTSATSFCDPSFTSCNRVERFFKMLYHMPWVSHNRVTVDYLPGDGASKGRKKNRPMSSWYHGMVGNSRRSSASLDLLSSGTPPSVVSPRTRSLRESLAMALGSPRSARQHKHSSDRHGRHRNRHHRSHYHTSSSSHHHHHRHGSGRRKRDTDTSMGTTNTGTNNIQKPTSSPLIPPIYPFQFPPYPYPAFSSFPMPNPAPAAVAYQPTQAGGHKHRSPRGPRGATQQPMVYAAPATYPSYQPMMGTPQVFLLQPTPPGQQTSPPNVPPSLVPGVGGHDSHAHGQASQVQSQQQGDPGQRQPTPGVQGQGNSQNIPGAF